LRYLILVLKGCCIGVANIIPGVSGGTMAVMLGIYERLIRALHHIGFSTARKLLSILTLKKGAISEARAELHRIDFGFLIAITFGALLAVVASARLLIYLLNEQHDPTYGFFSGLVLISVIIPFKMLKRFTVKECVSLLLAAGLTVGLTLSMSGEKRLESEQRKHELKESQLSGNVITGTEASTVAPQDASKDANHAVGVLLYLFLCSAIAVSAMILPGISGSFIFLLLGVYFDILAAVDNRDWVVIGFVALGGIVGLLAFTRLLNYVLERHHDLTISFLIGLMVASLYGLWPFRSYEMVGEERIDIVHILPQANINLAITVLATLIGCGVVLLFYRLESQRN
jgi:putative membrane protein